MSDINMSRKVVKIASPKRRISLMSMIGKGWLLRYGWSLKKLKTTLLSDIIDSVVTLKGGICCNIDSLDKLLQLFKQSYNEFFM